MADDTYRMERIKRLLRELQYEVTRGIMEREIDEEIGFRWYLPVSQKIGGGVVLCEFRTQPQPYPLEPYIMNKIGKHLSVVGKNHDTQTQ